MLRNQKLKKFKEAKFRFEKEMDLIRFLKSSMLNINLRKLMYTKLERYLLLNNRCFVVGGDHHCSSSELSCPSMHEKEIVGILKESPHIKKLFMGTFKSRKNEEKA